MTSALPRVSYKILFIQFCSSEENEFTTMASQGLATSSTQTPSNKARLKLLFQAKHRTWHAHPAKTNSQVKIQLFSSTMTNNLTVMKKPMRISPVLQCDPRATQWLSLLSSNSTTRTQTLRAWMIASSFQSQVVILYQAQVEEHCSMTWTPNSTSKTAWWSSCWIKFKRSKTSSNRQRRTALKSETPTQVKLANLKINCVTNKKS